MSASSSTITVGGWAWPMATSGTPTSRSDLPRLRPSLCRPSPLKVTPTVHHTRTPLPTPTSSPARTRTDSSRVVSGITCARKPPRPSPRPSSRSTATDRRAHAPHNRDTGRHHVAPCPVLIPSSGKGAPPLPPPRLRGRKGRASAGIRSPCRMTGPGPGCRRRWPTLTPKNRWPTGPGRPCRGCPPRVAWPWSLRDARAAGFQVGVLAVVAQVGADEWAQGDQLEVPGAQVVQGAGNEAAPQPLPFDSGVDLGVDEQDGARLGPVLDEAGTCRSEPELIAQLLGVVDDANVHLRPSPRF